MTSIIKSKQASVKFIVKVALLIFLLLIITTITLRATNNWRNATENCVGTCRSSCNLGEVQYSSKCYEEGTLKEGVCCTGAFEKEEKNQTERKEPIKIANMTKQITDEEANNDYKKPKIITQLGEGGQIPSPLQLIQNKDYKLKISSEGTNVNKCEVKILNPTNNDLITLEALSVNKIEQGNCENLEITIKTTNEDLEELKTITDGNIAILYIVLKDAEDEVLLSEERNLVLQIPNV